MLSPISGPRHAAEEALTAFDYQPATRVVFGCGALARLGELAAELRGTRVLVVTDPGIEKAGHVDRGLASLRNAGLRAAVFDGVEENPTNRHVQNALEAARRESVDLLVGLGGGSAMDTAKGVNFVLTNGGRIHDYWGVGKATKPMLPMIAVPTTAGTGSEAQSFALIADESTHQKMACGDKKAACRVAILDPEVTVSQPPAVTAVSGIDAISHAIESFVTRKRNPISSFFAREAWRLLRGGFAEAIEQPASLEGRAQTLLGAHWAGTAIENSMLGATHSAANPLTAHFGITHGTAIGVLLPHVIRFNAVECDGLYAELLDQSLESGAGEQLAQEIEELRLKAGLPSSLTECGVDRRVVPQLAEEAAQQWTARFNPRLVEPSDFVRLYESAF